PGEIVGAAQAILIVVIVAVGTDVKLICAGVGGPFGLLKIKVEVKVVGCRIVRRKGERALVPIKARTLDRGEGRVDIPKRKGSMDVFQRVQFGAQLPGLTADIVAAQT